MAIEVPDIPVTGTVIESAWGADVANSIAEIDPSGAQPGQVLKVNDAQDGYDFGGGGVALDWAGAMTGDPEFPHNGGSTTDVTISTDTTWDETDYPGRMVQLRKLTVAAGVTLTLEGGPWFLFIGEIEFGNTSSRISGDGPDGSSDVGTYGAASSQAATYARGAAERHTDARAEGGAGGAMLIVVAREFSGANGVISSNGGDGARNTSNAGSIQRGGGEGALSTSINADDNEQWYGAARSATNGVSGRENLSDVLMLLGDGATTVGGKAGGRGGSNTSSDVTGGGSGIGGGGGMSSASVAASGALPHITPNPLMLIKLAMRGCKGGGGGGARADTTGSNNSAGGGGGGAVVAWVRALTAAITLEANAGAGVGNAGNGAAGVVYLIPVP